MDYTTRVYWNTNTYGKAYRLKKSVLRTIFILLCVVTPATNWMIPIVNKIIRNDVVIRR